MKAIIELELNFEMVRIREAHELTTSIVSDISDAVNSVAAKHGYDRVNRVDASDVSRVTVEFGRY